MRPLLVLTIKNQRGASLIGLMVGLLVSLIGILGSLSLYKSLTQTSVDATFDAKHDGNVAHALTRITNLIQNAGFGLNEPTSQAERHIYWESAQSLYWRTREVVGTTFNPNDAATYESRCYRLRETALNLSNEKQIQVDSATCNEATPLSAIAMAWPTVNPSTEIINRTSLDRLNSSFVKDKARINLLDIQLLPNQACTPFGMISPPTDGAYSHVLVNVSHYTSTDLNSITDQNNITQIRSLSHQVCIGNPAYEPAP